MYVITGITGNVGGAIANSLLNDEVPFKGILRNQNKKNEWEEKGVSTLLADFNDLKILSNAFKDSEGVFILSPSFFDSHDPIGDNFRMMKTVCEAIRQASPKKVVYLSAVGAHLKNDAGAIYKLHEMEQLFSELNVPTVGIRAAFFMENFVGILDQAKNIGTIPSFLSPTSLSIPMVSIQDIAKLAIKLLNDTWEGHRIIELKGPCSYSPDDVANVLGYQFQRDIIAEAIPELHYEKVYESFGMTKEASILMAEMIKGFNNGHITFSDSEESCKGTVYLEDVFTKIIHA